MATQPLKIMIAVAVGITSLWVNTSHAQGGLRLPPPPPLGSGTGGITLSGSNPLPPPPPPPLPPLGSGTGGIVLTGTNFPPPPSTLSGTGAPVRSGSDGLFPPPPPPPQVSGTDGPLLPIGSIESLTEELEFTAVGSGSGSVKAVFVGINTSGTYRGSLNLVCGGLTSGTYTLTATLSDESTVTLGTFTSATKASAKPSKIPQKVAFGGKGGIPFPASVNPLEIIGLTISDADANALYTADLATVIDGVWMAHIALTAGDGAPTATGFADILAKAKQGNVDGCLAIHAKGLPASASYTYSLDGNDIGTVSTGSDGTLRFKVSSGDLPATVDLFSVKTLAVHDDANTVLVSTSF